MFHYIRNLKDSITHFQFDSVNCFQRPAALVYKYKKRGSERLYLMYCKLFDAFSIDAERSELKNYEHEIGIRCVNIGINSKEEFEQKITNLINKGYPVLVPGNLKALFYSKYYKIRDWGHLLLIKGYDKERQLYMILDNIHLENKNSAPKLSDFYIRYDDLYDFFYQFNDYYGHNIYYMEEVTEQQVVNERDRIVQYLRLLSDTINKKKYREYEIVKWLKEGGIVAHGDSILKVLENKNFVINIPKFKSILFEQLVYILENYSYNCEKLKQIVEKLEHAWKKDNLKFLKHIEQQDFEQLDFKISKVTLEYEIELLQEIKECIIYLEKMETLEEEKTTDFLCDNNEDDIIHYEKGSFIFDFNTSVTYNSWLTDEAPKVFLYSNTENKEQILFRVKCSILTDYDEFGYHTGIFVIAEDGSLFVFGLNYEKLFLFDYIGKCTIDSFKSEYNGEEYEIYIKRGERKISVGIIKNETEFIELGHYNIELQIKYAGIFCKTMGTCTKLKVAFRDFSVISW